MKKIVAFILTVVGIFIFESNVSADEINQVTEYDLSSDINVVDRYTTVNGENIEVIIEKIQSDSFIMRRALLSSGTYRVSKSSAGKWYVSYDVKINSNEQFTGASNLNLKAYIGSIISSSLTYTSYSAECNFKHNFMFMNSNVKVKASISNGKLIVN